MKKKKNLPEDGMVAYNPDAFHQFTLRGNVPPVAQQRPRKMLPPKKDHSMLGQLCRGSDELIVHRCPKCGAKWIEPDEASTCTCNTEK